MTAVACYLGSIVGANLLVSHFHLVTFFGITFPAGAPLIGLTFSARDYVQRKYGKWRCWWFMGLALLVTVAFNPKIALASGSAFVVAEGLDWLIYTLTRRPFAQRLILSNIVSTPLDSAVFVTVAFGWHWPAVWGQTLVKFASSLVAIAFQGKERC